MMLQLTIDHTEIERRKQLRRNLWDYKPVDHIPIVFWLTSSCGYTTREQYESTEIQFKVNEEAIKRSLELLPDDYIPFAFVTQGYVTIATMFGMEIYWSDDPDQTPGSKGHLIDDLEQVYSLSRPGMDAGIMPENIKRLRYHAENLPPDVYITGIDSGGPLNTCKDLLDTNLLYTGFYDNPEAMHHLLNLVTEVQLESYHTLVQAVGGIERMTCIDFSPTWAPEKYKSFVSDDICATIGPNLFKEFSIPYNNRLYKPWGSGLMHNCGPNPSKHLYLDHNPKLKGLNCSYKFSHAEFPEFKDIFSGWGIIEAMFDSGETPEQMLAQFRLMAETLAPDTVGIPLCIVDDTWPDSDITDLYWEMRKIGEAYAANMRWVGTQ
jgi:uroporphyrinogen-III decarboxylase